MLSKISATAFPGSDFCRLFSAITILLFGLVLTTDAVSIEQCPDQPVIEGKADLRCWDGESRIILTGGWHLSYQAAQEDVTFEGIYPVPQLWSEADFHLPNNGRGVYRATLQLNHPLSRLGLTLPHSNMARKVSVFSPDGEEEVVFDSGNTDLENRAFAPMRMPVITLPDVVTGSELVIIIRNSESVHGGIEDDVTLAPVDILVRGEQKLIIYAMTIATVLIVFFFVNLFIWQGNKKDVAVLILGIIALLAAARQSVISGFLYELFPHLSNLFDTHMGWGTFFGVAITGSLYFRFNYPELIPQWLTWITIAATSVGVVLYLFWPLYIVQNYAVYFRPFLVVSLLVLLTFLWAGLRRPNVELKFTLLGATIAVIALIADTLYYQFSEYYAGISISALGLIGFMGVETVMMAQRYSRSVHQTARLSSELQNLNTSLEEKIEERTTELASMNERLEDMAHTDPLTGLANRRAFDEALRHEEARGNRNQHTMVIGIIDLDDLKHLNDRFGHLVGDEILSQVAEMLRNSIRAEDVSCRWGGDEFSILFPQTTGKDAYRVSDRLRMLVRSQDFPVGEETVNVSLSIGLAEWAPGDNVEDVIDAADKALYQSKELGRDRVTGAWQL